MLYKLEVALEILGHIEYRGKDFVKEPAQLTENHSR